MGSGLLNEVNHPVFFFLISEFCQENEPFVLNMWHFSRDLWDKGSVVTKRTNTNNVLLDSAGSEYIKCLFWSSFIVLAVSWITYQFCLYFKSIFIGIVVSYI